MVAAGLLRAVSSKKYVYEDMGVRRCCGRKNSLFLLL